MVPLEPGETSYHLAHIANGSSQGRGIKTRFILFGLRGGATAILETTEDSGAPLTLERR